MKKPATPCSAPEAIASWKPNLVVSQPPELQPHAAASAHTPEPRTTASRRYADSTHPVGERAGHDQRRRHREEREREEEDETQVVERSGPSPELHGGLAPQKPGMPPSAGLASPCFGQPSSKQPYVSQPK